MSPKLQPKMIGLSLGGECGFKCEYCFLGNEERGKLELPKGRVIDLLSEAKTIGFSSMSYMGGEPLHDLDLFVEIIRHGNQIGFGFQPCYTNGLRVGPYENATQLFQRFKKAGIDEAPVAISFDEIKIQQLNEAIGNGLDFFLGIIKAFRENYTGQDLELGRVTVNDNSIRDLLLRLKGINQVRSFNIENKSQRVLKYFPEGIDETCRFFDHFRSLQDAYIIRFKEGTQIIIHNMEFNDSGFGKDFLVKNPELGRQEDVKKEISDSVFIGKSGKIYLSYQALAKAEDSLGQYEKSGDLERILSPVI